MSSAILYRCSSCKQFIVNKFNRGINDTIGNTYCQFCLHRNGKREWVEYRFTDYDHARKTQNDLVDMDCI